MVHRFAQFTGPVSSDKMQLLTPQRQSYYLCAPYQTDTQHRRTQTQSLHKNPHLNEPEHLPAADRAPG